MKILEKIRRDMNIFKLNRFCSLRKLRFIVQQINQKNQMQLNIQRDLSIMDYPKSPTPINKMPLISLKQAAVHSNNKPNIERNRSPSQMQRDSINWNQIESDLRIFYSRKLRVINRNKIIKKCWFAISKSEKWSKK